MSQETIKDAGVTEAAKAEATATAESLTAREAELLAQVMANNPALTREEALEHLRLAGM